MSSQFEDKDSGLPKGHWYCNKKKGGCGKHWAKETQTPPTPTPPQGEIVPPGASSNAREPIEAHGQSTEGWESVIEKLSKDRPDLFNSALAELKLHSVGNAADAKRVMDYFDNPF